MRFICVRYPSLEMTVKPSIKREVDGVILKEPRQIIKFKEGVFETENQKEIDFIKRHVDFGNGNIVMDEQEKYQEPTEEEKVVIEHEKKKGRPRKNV